MLIYERYAADDAERLQQRRQTYDVSYEYEFIAEARYAADAYAAHAKISRRKCMSARRAAVRESR